MRIYLDNIEVQYPDEKLLKPSFTLRRRDEEGLKSFSFTGDMEFTGADYTYLFGKLKTDANALTNIVVLKFVDDCCNDKEYKFRITAETIKWCENSCSMTAAAIEHSDESDQIKCLNSKLIWDDTPTNWPDNVPFTQRQHPRFAYCNELRPIWLHDVILIFSVLYSTLMLTIAPILLVLGVIVTIVNLIVNAVNVLGGNLCGGKDPCIDFDNDPSTGPFQEMLVYSNMVLDFIVGCGRKHPSPLVRDYAQNVCKACGISFQSTIFTDSNSPYFNTCYHNAPVKKGIDPSDNNTYWIDDNKPLKNGVQYFDQLKGMFNAEWTVRNNTLYFERKDYFLNNTPWLNIPLLPIDEYEICYTWDNKKRYSYGNFEYQKDAINTLGSEARYRWSDIVEWNNPASAMQSGELKPLIEFSACRFRNDGIERDVLSTYQNFPFIGPRIQNNENVIILNQHLCFMPMLLIWDPNTGLANAKVSPLNAPNNPHPRASANQFYNYPMWFWEGDSGAPGNLYTNFWYIENPRYSNFAGFRYEATVDMTCERLTNMDLDGTIITPEGPARIDEIIVNYSNKTLTIKGTI